MNNLQARAASAVVLAAAVLWLTWLGGMPFRLLAILGGAVVYYEWVSMAGLATGRWLVGAIAAAIVAALFVWGLPAGILIVVLIAGIVVTAIVGWAFGRDLSAAAALCYAGFAAIALAFLRGDDGAGLRSMLFLFAVVWATDIAAYAVGRTLGGPKLAPSISPGKTWSGAIGGAVAGIAAGLGTAALAGIGITGLLAATALLLTIVSQAGDLFESAVKRHFGVKDSGHIIPGHGGLMDRVDGLVAAGFALYLIGAALAGLDHPSHGFFGP
ncbi:MAG: phosphatidate cytidylyltransferase [Rhizobiales bacterium 65-79]|jgi:phosphatidate cytidylyltransferase|nr:phosphatidate cytidylyltransferase [Hyphomicrobiales bacterium]OJU05173.1 MAG: phosphatidate cytidylyltransferase [Rhizobiales bacterium 65-79]